MVEVWGAGSVAYLAINGLLVDTGTFKAMSDKKKVLEWIREATIPEVLGMLANEHGPLIKKAILRRIENG